MLITLHALSYLVLVVITAPHCISLKDIEHILAFVRGLSEKAMATQCQIITLACNQQSKIREHYSLTGRKTKVKPWGYLKHIRIQFTFTYNLFIKAEQSTLCPLIIFFPLVTALLDYYPWVICAPQGKCYVNFKVNFKNKPLDESYQWTVS